MNDSNDNQKSTTEIYYEILKLKYKLIYITPERLGLGEDACPSDQSFL